MYSNLPIHLSAWLRSPQTLVAIAVCLASAVFSIYLLTRKSLTTEERERGRREQLAHAGRITDGSITDTQWIPSRTESGSNTPSTTPSLLLYQYEIAGVIYECAQDVSSLPDLVRHVRIDLPVQVRFDPRNPANSIVVAESWTGLRLASPPATPAKARVAVEEPIPSPVKDFPPENQSTEHTHA